jgi:cyclophilin family peptidyl-prolyl cis-trans isomerase/HEAT repeat protein
MRLTLLAATLLLGGAIDLAAQRATAAARQAMLLAEDHRASTDADLAPLVRGLASPDVAVVRQAIRGLGRMERASLIGRVSPLLADARPAVRVEAAHAIGQLGQDTSGTPAVAAALVAAAAKETDPAVLGVLARSLSRLPNGGSTDVPAALKALAAKPGPVSWLVDLARSLEAAARSEPLRPLFDAPTVERLRALAAHRDAAAAEAAAKVRRAAVATLVRVDRGNEAGITAALADTDVEVRRLGVQWAADSGALASRKRLLTAALADRDPMVRLEAIRAWSRYFQAEDCGPLIRALRDPAPHVGLGAIDLLGRPCPAAANAADALYPLVDSLAGTQRGLVGTLARWHRGARAMVSLARIAPNRVRGVLNRAASDETWQVRMYAARAASILGDPDRLRDFMSDRDDNVREAAVAGLLRVRGHGADSLFFLQLRRPDYQLVMTTAAALAGAPNKPQAAAALVAALDRITAEGKETSRDPRVAILERLAEVGGAGQAPALERYLTDFDPEVARRAAGLLSRWTGTAREARPKRLAPAPIDWAAAQRLKGSRLRFTMAQASGGGVFEVALDPETAPATVLRVVGRARQKLYDGLTFHRVEPNFVIQGGSPGANEFAGDALFMRDEVGPLSHERGTLGISTRGRDTGDAQIFVNLIDNLRLDFNYTVWGRVVRGIEVVDGMLEGDVFERVEVVSGR